MHGAVAAASTSKRKMHSTRSKGRQALLNAAPLSAAELEALRMRRINPAQYYRDNLGQLGFGDLEHAMIQTVKELVDNALDACELMKVSPEIGIRIEATSRVYDITAKTGETKSFPIYKVKVEDNGCGVVRQKLAKCFGTVLYGSKFFSMKQSRGQQGIGAHAAIIYSQMTTLEPTRITSKTEKDDLALQIDLKIDCDNNRPIIQNEEFVDFPSLHGTVVRLYIPGKYSQRLLDYTRQLSLANPHADIWLKVKPSHTEPSLSRHFARSIHTLPPDPKEIKPHILSMEPGILHEMINQDRCCKTQRKFLAKHFCRISTSKARQIVRKVSRDLEAPLKILDPEKTLKVAKSLHLMNPPLEVLSPIGEGSMETSLRKLYSDAEFIKVISRAPWSYRGVPFQVEVALTYGGASVTEDCTVSREGVVKPKIVRIANKCPLPYDSKDCVLFKAVKDIDWRIYRLTQTEGGLPSAPMIIIVSLTSSRVPYIGPGKYGVAYHEEIYSEAKLGLQTLGRLLRDHVQRKERQASEGKRLSLLQLYTSETARDISIVTGEKRKEVEALLLSTLRRKPESGRKPPQVQTAEAIESKPMVVAASGEAQLEESEVRRGKPEEVTVRQETKPPGSQGAVRRRTEEQATLDSYIGAK